MSGSVSCFSADLTDLLCPFHDRKKTIHSHYLLLDARHIYKLTVRSCTCKVNVITDKAHVSPPFNSVLLDKYTYMFPSHLACQLFDLVDEC